MSAFVINTDTMHRCVRGILAKSQYGQVIRHFMDIDTSANDAGTQIGRLLFTLNIEAVQQRYPGTLDNPHNMPGPIDEDGNSTALSEAETYCYCPSTKPQTRKVLVDSFKALECLEYQCSEVDVPERPDYAALQKASGLLAAHIVRLGIGWKE
jgi:hypothetical protein